MNGGVMGGISFWHILLMFGGGALIFGFGSGLRWLIVKGLDKLDRRNRK